MNYTPEEAVKVRAYIVTLHREGKPFPPRKEVANLLGIDIPILDYILSDLIATGEATVDYRLVEKGKERYLIPV